MGSLGPTAMASLSLKVLPVTVSPPDAASSMPPPNPPPSAVPRASLPLTVQLVSVAAPESQAAAALGGVPVTAQSVGVVV